MKKQIIVIIAMCVLGVAGDALRQEFQNPPPGFGEVPFWWWTGEKLDKARLLEQLEMLHAAGVSGTQVNYAHARSNGWRTADVEPEIFSDEWWDVFNFIAEESAKRGMGIGLSGYTLDWPGNDNLFRKLGISANDTRAHKLASPCTDSAGRVNAKPVDKTLDPLNPESARRVIERFFDPFEKRLSPLARRALNYFFQDELRLAGDENLWSKDFAEEFKRRKEYDIMPFLPSLAGTNDDMTAKVRLDYNDVMVSLTGERYFKPIFDWHASRGLIYACDPASRGHNPLEFGDYMRAMRWYTAPGFDTPGTSADVIKNKVGSSIAHLYQRPRVWLEGYHSQGWQAAPSTIFNSTVHNFVYGSTLLNLHGLYYSTYGGWWEWAPPCYHFRMPYWQHVSAYLKYFERLSYILSRGAHVADVAVLNPLEPLIVDRVRGKKSVSLAHSIVNELVTRRSIDVDFIDGDSVLRGECTDGNLCVSGERYRVIVLADMFAMRANVLRKLVAFKKSGGRVIAFGSLPTLTDIAPAAQSEISELVRELDPIRLPERPGNADYAKVISAIETPDFSGPRGVKVLHRRIDDTDVYYLVDLPEKSDCVFRVSGAPEIWNPWTGKTSAAENWQRTNGMTRVTLKGGEQPVLVVFRPSDKTGAVKRTEIAGERAKPVALDGQWRMSLVPTLNNKWGDYRLPAKNEMIGAEIRRFKYDSDGTATESTVGFSPQFRCLETGELHYFSWRWGEETRPAYQDWHHGLNRRVGDDFFTFGHYDNKMYDVVPKKGDKPRTLNYQTFVVVPEDCKVRVETHGVKPESICLDGKNCTTNEVLDLFAGNRCLQVRYASFGRAAIVVRRTDVPARPSDLPLSMRWYDDPSVLRFDPIPGTRRETRFTATVPPGFASAEFVLDGELLSAVCGGKALTVKHIGGNEWTAVCDEPVRCGGELELVVRENPGVRGCGVFREPVRLACEEGEAELGDWARFEGLRCYSGGIVYEKDFELSSVEAGALRELDLGNVAATCDVSINGGEKQVLCTPPWKIDVRGKLREGRNKVRITVFNTLNNHYQTIPTRYKRPVKDVPSGLLGPVKLHRTARRTPPRTGAACRDGCALPRVQEPRH